MGIFGLVGAGRTEALRELFGLDADAWNQLSMEEASHCCSSDCHTRLRAGVGLLSEDRKHEGLMLDQSLGREPDPQRTPALHQCRLALLVSTAQHPPSTGFHACKSSSSTAPSAPAN
jgi:ABC-type sugar transport system ATPase subunit